MPANLGDQRAAFTTLQRCVVSAEFATGLVAAAVAWAQTYGVPAIANGHQSCPVATHRVYRGLACS
ncbi:MAG: hypothetical protein ACFB12_06040 [Leptolyngbyaceae cyanobacterium]